MSTLVHPKKYSTSFLTNDLMAGLTVAIMLIPQGMAYAMMAGLDPIYGLYAGLVPMLVYPIFGTSKYLSVGPVALVSILLLSGLQSLAEPGTSEFLSLALLTSFVAGVIQILLFMFRLGFLVNFLSYPVIAGFTSAAAIIISISQLKYLFGLELPRSVNSLNMIKELFGNIQDINFPSLIVGLIALVIIVGLKKIKSKLPGALLVLILGIVATKFLNLTEAGITILGNIPKGLPSFTTIDYSWVNIQKVLPLSIIICIISFIESLSIAKTLGAKNNEYNIDANREFLSLGLAKVVGAFFLAFPNTGSFTRSAVNEQSEAKSGYSSIFAAIMVGLVLLFLTDMFYYLPKTILAAIVISAVFGLIDYKIFKKLLKTDRRDLISFLTTFILTLTLGVQSGVLSGIIVSLILIIQRISDPHVAILGKIQGSKHYRNIERFTNATCPKNTLIMRYDGDLFFGNVDHFYTVIVNQIEQKENIEFLILNLTALHSPDSTGLNKLLQVIKYASNRNITVLLTDVKGPVRDKFERIGFYEFVNKQNIFLSVENACDELLKKSDLENIITQDN
ncbi:MAG: sulfate permease [Saprospiraceae bacterium]|nr:sulfate permease [Bacteroidia bacterium]NNL91194.1 sulfate permease [Saprospiraceae bacterium]